MCVSVRKRDILFQTLSTVSHATSPSPQFFSKELAQITLVLFQCIFIFSSADGSATKKKTVKLVSTIAMQCLTTLASKYHDEDSDDDINDDNADYDDDMNNDNNNDDGIKV